MEQNVLYFQQRALDYTKQQSRLREMRLVHFPGGGWKKKCSQAAVKAEVMSKVIVNAVSTENKVSSDETKSIITRASANRSKLHQPLSSASSVQVSTSHLTGDSKKSSSASLSITDISSTSRLRHLDKSNLISCFDDSIAVKDRRQGTDGLRHLDNSNLIPGSDDSDDAVKDSQQESVSNDELRYLDNSNLTCCSDDSNAVKDSQRECVPTSEAHVASSHDLKSTTPQRPKRNICMKKLVRGLTCLLFEVALVVV